MRDKENMQPLDGVWNHRVKFELVPINECIEDKMMKSMAVV